jgi:predicted metal-dependent hydrolase
MDKGRILEQLAKFKDDNSKALWLLSQVEQMENDYNEFKDRLSDATAKYVDEILSEDLEISENIRKRNIFDNLIQQFKIRISYEECLMDEEALSLLKEAKGTILNLRSNIAKAKTSTAMVKDDIRLMSKQLYINNRLDEMKINNPSQYRVKKILLEGDIDNLSEMDIDEKINLLLEG